MPWFPCRHADRRHRKRPASAAPREGYLRLSSQRPIPAGNAIATSTREEGSGTASEVLINKELIAKSPWKLGGAFMPKTIDVISALESRTPMKMAEPS